MAEPSQWTEAILRVRSPLQPIATNIAPQLQSLRDIEAVIFDVYGTLIVSGSGDVGSADGSRHDQAFQQAIQSLKLSEKIGDEFHIENLLTEIRETNERHQSDECPKPEIDIVDTWLRALEQHGITLDVETCVRLACEYEARANPTWPMPGAVELLRRIGQSQQRLGIVSNAQLFTLPLVESLLDPPQLTTAGFDLSICIFSNRFRQAKPGPRLFDALSSGLSAQGIRPHQAIYVGNDMLNDVWAASQAGLRTAWFAGDQRSCRDRQDDPRCQSLRPDVVLTSLLQLLQCFEIG